jgi:tRNA pseudouridine38-40 synthase
MKKKTDASLINYKLVIAYDGTAYQGYQRQGEHPTIQLAVENVLKRIFGFVPIIYGSGRTDSGVHALGQVISFQVEKNFKPKVLQKALNSFLPFDIRVLSVKQVPLEFHARFDAVGKEYLYRINCDPIGDPFEVRTSLFAPYALDIKKMKQAANYFVGKHDFTSFASNPGYERETMVRTIFKVSLVKKKKMLEFRVRGDGFLYRMVRNMVGALLKVGREKMTPQDIKRILNEKSRSKAPNTAPAHGLYLVKVDY